MTPAPLPLALRTPAIGGMTKAAENTGPMNPTDCATTSTPFASLAARVPHAAQPPSGRPNQTCAWPVPTEAS